MIGLGSNRLTCCRRGGMSVTQAGRGGMEWLGVRVPSWASPYSAAATAALKAQFPTQWPTIRDYGFSHPEIVGYMNAYAPEDAKIAYSLVEGIGTRWLKSDGAFLNTGVKANGNITLKMQVLYYEAQNGYTCTWGGENGGNQYSMFRSAGTSGYFHCNGTNVLVATLNTPWNVEVTPRAFIIEGTSYKTYTQGTHNYPIYLFQIMRGGSTSGYSVQKSQLSYFQIKDGNTLVRNFVPFKRNGAMGMIDLLTGTFYGNANSSGSFTESIESPA